MPHPPIQPTAGRGDIAKLNVPKHSDTLGDVERIVAALNAHRRERDKLPRTVCVALALRYVADSLDDGTLSARDLLDLLSK